MESPQDVPESMPKSQPLLTQQIADALSCLDDKLEARSNEAAKKLASNSRFTKVGVAILVFRLVIELLPYLAGSTITKPSIVLKPPSVSGAQK